MKEIDSLNWNIIFLKNVWLRDIGNIFIGPTNVPTNLNENCIIGAVKYFLPKRIPKDLHVTPKLW